MTQTIKDKIIFSFLQETLWLMEPVILGKMKDVFVRHAGGLKLTGDEIKEILAASGKKETNENPNGGYYVENGAAIIPVYGVLAKHSSQVNGISQARGTSVEQISADIDKALADPTVDRIILHVESPGGSAAGIPDLAQKISEVNKIKTVLAFIEDIAASGACWLASQASEVYINRGGEAGSIGVYVVIEDSSKAAEREGYEYKVLSTGKYKGVAVPGVKLANLDDIETRIRALHDLFVKDVAAGRGMSIEDLAPIADGRVLSAPKAIEAGLVDGIATLKEIIIDNKSAVVRDNKLVSTTAANNDSELNGDTKMAEKNESKLTADEIEKQKNDAVAAAVTANNNRILAVTKVLAGNQELLEKAVADPNCDVTAATAMLVPALKAENKKISDELAAANKKLEAIAAAGNPPVKVAATDNLGDGKQAADVNAAAGTDDGKKETYMAKVRQLVKDGEKAGVKKGDAMITAAKALPKSYEAWMIAKQPDINC
jgi:signal peptide peptidase SppA